MQSTHTNTEKNRSNSDDFMNILKMEYAHLLGGQMNLEAMDETLSLLCQDYPEIIGSYYDCYQRNGLTALTEMIKKFHGKSLQQRPTEPKTTYKDAMIAWFYRSACSTAYGGSAS